MMGYLAKRREICLLLGVFDSLSYFLSAGSFRATLYKERKLSSLFYPMYKGGCGN